MTEFRPSDVMAAIDEALAPAMRNAERLGTVGFGDLKQALHGVRQALSIFVHGIPETVAAEPSGLIAKPAAGHANPLHVPAPEAVEPEQAPAQMKKGK